MFKGTDPEGSGNQGCGMILRTEMTDLDIGFGHMIGLMFFFNYLNYLMYYT